MKFLNLTGFVRGDSLQISVSQNALTAGPYGVSSWGGIAPTGNISITVNRSHLRVAPDSVRFWVDLSRAEFDTQGPTGGEIYDRRLHDLIFLWDFGDTAGAWTAPEKGLPAWKNRNTAKGPFVAHMYTRPGTYTASVLVVEPSSGKTASATVEIAVADPDVVYARANTICVNPVGDSDFTGAPAGAARENMDLLTHADANWPKYRNTGPKRWLFKRGAIYSQSLDISLEANGLYFGTYGSGVKPIINAVPTSNFREAVVYCNGLFGGTEDTPDLRFTDLDFRGIFDPVTTIYSDPGEFCMGLLMQGSADVAVSRCDFSGFHSVQINLQPGTTEERANLHVDDCFHTDMGGQYPIFMSPTTNLDSSFSATGSRVTTKPDALNKGGSNSLIRISSCPNIHVRGSDFYLTNNAHNAIRLSGTPKSDGHIVNVQSNAFEGGFGAVTMGGNSAEAAKGVGRSAVFQAIYDGNIWVGHYTGECMFDTLGTGITIRNNLAIVPNVTYNYDTPNPFLGFVKLRDAAVSGPYDPIVVGGAPIRVYNNTFVCERAFSENNSRLPVIINDFSGQPGYTNVVEENNILHMPNMVPAATAFAPLATDVLWTARNPGLRSADTRSLDASWATPTDAVRSYRPLPGSAALGAALTGDVSYMDITLQDRPEPPSMGAWEAD